VAALGQVEDLLKQEHAPIEQYLVGETEDPVLAGLSNSLAAAQQELRKLGERFTPDAPAVKEEQIQVDGQIKTIRDYVLGRSMRAQRQLDSLGQMIAQFEKKLRTVPGAEFDLAQLTRNAEVLSKMYSFLLERQQQAAVTKAATMSRNRILDAAVVPYREDSPALGLRLMAALLLGLLGSAAFAVVHGWSAPTFQSESELARELPQLAGEPAPPVLALVPESVLAGAGRLSVRSLRRAGAASPWTAFPPSSAFAEAFRHLRTNLYLASGRVARVLLISSPSPGDGKSVCARALAAALAADGKHVVLVDADMRRQADDAGGRGAREPGLGEVLAGRRQWSDVVQLASADTPFDAIPAGASDEGAAELLSGASFVSLIAYLRKSYDFVVVDSPPFPLVVDALVVASYADCVLSVLRVGNTAREAARAHLQRFVAMGVRHAVIVNGVRAPTAYGQYGYGATYAAAPSDALAAPDRVGAPA
jgi:tyrosine-protein kinase Etk/Wzc